jgi:hypothetical protein
MIRRHTTLYESIAMIHPLLTPRLYCQTHNQPPLPPLQERGRHPVRAFLLRSTLRFYRRWGAGLGFILGLAIACWLWLPDLFG